MPALICLAVSTILNAIYFMKTVIRIYTPDNSLHYQSVKTKDEMLYAFTMVGFIAINLLLGINSHPVVLFIEQGLEMFS